MKNKYLILALKLLFIFSSFAIILWQTDPTKIWLHIKNCNPFYLLTALIVMILAQIISAYRMRFYYKLAGLNLSGKFAISLYFTAMMLNNILPGGIGGDGYKIYAIGKQKQFSKIKALRIAVSERASGLFALLLLTVIFYFCGDFATIIPYQNQILILLAIILLPAYLIAVNKLLHELPKTAICSQFYSLPIQLLNAAIAILLLLGISSAALTSQEIMGYLVIFMLAAVASILPISIGGAGLRELTFLYGTKLLHLNEEIGIAIAFIFFLTTLICSSLGLIFWRKGVASRESF